MKVGIVNIKYFVIMSILMINSVSAAEPAIKRQSVATVMFNEGEVRRACPEILQKYTSIVSQLVQGGPLEPKQVVEIFDACMRECYMCDNLNHTILRMAPGRENILLRILAGNPHAITILNRDGILKK